MQRRTYLRGVGTLAAVGLAGCVGDSGGESTRTDEATPTTDGTPAGECGDGTRLRNASFSCGTTGWTVGRDLPTDPNTGDPVETSVAVTGFGREEPPGAPGGSDDAQALELRVDGRHGEGTLWVAQSTDLTDCEYLSLAARSPDGSADAVTNVVAYVGPDRRLGADDFTVYRSSGAGWQTATYGLNHEGAGLVAVGIRVTSETTVRRYLDDLRLE